MTPLDLAGLQRDWPGRDSEIELLHNLTYIKHAISVPVFVWGPTGVGKTTLCRSLLRFQGQQHAYVRCVETMKPSLQLQSIVDQLSHSAIDEEPPANPISSSEDFQLALEVLCPLTAPAKWLVLDGVDAAHPDLMTVVMRLREWAPINLGTLLIASRPWRSCWCGSVRAGLPTPLRLHLPPYTVPQMKKIFLRLQPAHVEPTALWQLFLQHCLLPFLDATTCVRSLWEVVVALLPEYLAPIQSGRLKPSDGAKLFAAIKPALQRALQAYVPGQQLPVGVLAAPRPEVGAAIATAPALDFQIPHAAKFLLLAAFVASHNRAAVDRRVFDPTFSSRAAKGRNKALTADREAAAAAAAKVAAPGTFSVERLLHVFWKLMDWQEEDAEGVSEDEQLTRMQSTEVMALVSTLVRLRLLQRSGVELLDGAKYTCCLPEDMAHLIARSVSVRLGDFLRLA